MPPGRTTGVSYAGMLVWEFLTLKTLRNSRKDDSDVQPPALGWVCSCVLSAAICVELVAMYIYAADGGAQQDPQALMMLRTCLCTTLLSSVQFVMPIAASFPFSHIGEHYSDFSFFCCRILLLNIPWTFLIPCAFSSHLPRMPLDRAHPQQLCRQCRARGSGWRAEECRSRGISRSLGIQPTETSWSSAVRFAKSCVGGRKTPSNRSRLENNLLERT